MDRDTMRDKRAKRKSKRGCDRETSAVFFAWRKVWKDKLLDHPNTVQNPRLFCLGHVIGGYLDWHDYSCFPSRETLASKLGIKPRQISVMTRQLQEMGFIKTVRRGRNSSNLIVATMPIEAQSSAELDADKMRYSAHQAGPKKGASMPHDVRSSNIMMCATAHPNIVSERNSGDAAQAAYPNGDELNTAHALERDARDTGEKDDLAGVPLPSQAEDDVPVDCFLCEPDLDQMPEVDSPHPLADSGPHEGDLIEVGNGALIELVGEGETRAGKPRDPGGLSADQRDEEGGGDPDGPEAPLTDRVADWFADQPSDWAGRLLANAVATSPEKAAADFAGMIPRSRGTAREEVEQALAACLRLEIRVRDIAFPTPPPTEKQETGRATFA